jgi:selenide,water dikinase
LDFITPVVDDPKAWGEIAAANAISDVFAMGGRPFVALNIVAFPINCLPLDTLKAVMEGGYSKVIDSGAFLMGGHSVEDEEPKYGLCVFGEVEKDALWKTTGADPGDLLILTKPLGSGIIATAVKADMVDDPAWAEDATKWMSKLNDLPLKMPRSMRKAIKSCTDVTGFGLAGHCLDMLSTQKVNLEMESKKLPLMDGALELASMGLLPAGAYTNRSLYEGRVDGLDSMGERADFLFDPQTSGGLLLAVSPDKSEELMELAIDNGFEKTTVIGRFKDGDGRIQIV